MKQTNKELYSINWV